MKLYKDAHADLEIHSLHEAFYPAVNCAYRIDMVNDDDETKSNETRRQYYPLPETHPAS